jgi:hypothetical protein
MLVDISAIINAIEFVRAKANLPFNIFCKCFSPGNSVVAHSDHQF